MGFRLLCESGQICMMRRNAIDTPKLPSYGIEIEPVDVLSVTKEVGLVDDTDGIYRGFRIFGIKIFTHAFSRTSWTSG